MATINTSGSGYISPSTNGGIAYSAYNGGILIKQKKMLEQALWILKNNLKGYKPCNDCFKALPRGETFDELMENDRITISYSKNAHYAPKNIDVFALTIANDISVTQLAYNRGVWVVAATLVHELAHVNGAPTTTHQAEGTLLCCGMKKGHIPGLVG